MTTTFKTWEDAFDFLANQAMQRQVLVVIDEFPYMVNGNSSIPSILQNSWDQKLKNSQVMLVLCGPSMAFIEKELLTVKNPLYGRLTGNYKLTSYLFMKLLSCFVALLLKRLSNIMQCLVASLTT